MTKTTTFPPNRILSVDMLRGLTIALMILVNDPGDWNNKFSQLDHAPWNGFTLTDLVFPTFLFLVGASIIFSMQARQSHAHPVRRILFRFFKIAALAIALAYFPRMHWTHMRLYGVLMRIALCYLIAAFILLKAKRPQTISIIIATLLIGYWLLLRYAKVPGAGHPITDFPLLDPVQNLTAWLDRAVSAFTLKYLHTGVLYLTTSDPEGLLSTLPAVATVLLGALAGQWLQKPQTENRKLLGLTLAGLSAILLGFLWAKSFPLNKNLWTSSFVLFAGGWTTLALAYCSWLVDEHPKPWPKWLTITTWPWFVFGSNAIAAFTIAAIYVKTAVYIKIAGADGKPHNLLGLAYRDIFARHGSNEWTSLAFAISFVALCFLPIYALWRKKIFLKL